VPLAHRDIAVDHYFNRVVDYPVDDRLGNRPVLFGANPFIPFGAFVLRAEDCRAGASGFDDFKQIKRFQRRQAAEQPLVENQEIGFLESLYGLLERPAAFGDVKVVDQFRHPYVPYRFELPASGVPKRARYEGLSVSARAFKRYVMMLANILAGGMTKYMKRYIKKHQPDYE
jgi:hypothetical protein